MVISRGVKMNNYCGELTPPMWKNKLCNEAYLVAVIVKRPVKVVSSVAPVRDLYRL